MLRAAPGLAHARRGQATVISCAQGAHRPLRRHSCRIDGALAITMRGADRGLAVEEALL